MRRTIVALLLLLAAAVVIGGPVTASSDPPGIKYVTARHLDSIEGADIYAAYCQVCHGPRGRGNGPAARRLSTPVPDLSTIGERDGAYNVIHVRLHVSDRHQHVVMPDWDEILYHNYSQQRGYAELAALNLARHIQRLQVVHEPR